MAASGFAASTVLYGEQSLERACAEIASVGIGAVDVWHVRGWCEHLAGGAAAVGETLRRHGLRLEAISAFGASDAELEVLLSDLALLGGRALVTGSTPPDVTVARFASRMAIPAARAAELGVSLAIENHGHATIDSIDSMAELASLLPGAGLGFALAPIHLWARGQRTEDAIRRLRGRIAFMYIWDWGPTAQTNWKDPQEQFVGTGRIDFPPIFAALRETGYDRPLGLFAHGPEHWPPERTTEHLRVALRRAEALAEDAARA